MPHRARRRGCVPPAPAVPPVDVRVLTCAPQVRRVAFECLVRIVSLYYELLQPYMQGLFTVRDAPWHDSQRTPHAWTARR